MNRVSGRVIQDDTQQSVKDVIVVLYDIDASQQTELDATRRALPQDSLATRYLQFIYGGEDTKEAPSLGIAQPIADRLGSVITDARGQFELTYEDSEFRVQDQEARSDLVLLVIALDRSSPSFSSSQLIVPMGTPEHAPLCCLCILMPLGLVKHAVFSGVLNLNALHVSENMVINVMLLVGDNILD